jgi:hypothetical protein
VFFRCCVFLSLVYSSPKLIPPLHPADATDDAALHDQSNRCKTLIKAILSECTSEEIELVNARLQSVLYTPAYPYVKVVDLALTKSGLSIFHWSHTCVLALIPLFFF